MTIKLTEELNVYIDDDTGNEYVYDGTKLILIKKGTKAAIGDKGDEEFQKEEERKRNEEAAKNGTLESKEELENRLKKIQDALADPEMAKKVTKEATDKKAKEDLKKQEQKAKRELERFRNDPIVKFENSLNKFLKAQIEYASEPSYNRFSRRYSDPDFILKGNQWREKKGAPTVQVYFDRSGSWDESKTKVGRAALATLNKYVRIGKLKLNISYFNSVVFDNYIENGTDGTYGSPILADVLAKRPDNVIVMTDSDITDCREYVQVPGVVWYLFSGGVSENLREHLTGKIATESYILDSI